MLLSKYDFAMAYYFVSSNHSSIMN